MRLLQPSANTKNVNRARRGVWIRAKAKRIYAWRHVTASSSDEVLNGIARAEHEQDVIKLCQDLHATSKNGYVLHVKLGQQTERGFTVIFPPLDGIDMQ